MSVGKKITESELVDLLKNQVVSQLNIVQTCNGNFQVSITITWKEGEWRLVTVRGKYREWASLDRLVRHLNGFAGDLPVIALKLVKNP